MGIFRSRTWKKKTFLLIPRYIRVLTDEGGYYAHRSQQRTWLWGMTSIYTRWSKTRGMRLWSFEPGLD